MLRQRLLGLVLALILVTVNAAPPALAVPASGFLAPGAAQSQATTASEPDLAARLAAIEKRVEERRKELGVPGLSLVIVKDDRVIFQKGFGLKDLERNLPVTPETLFAIGSCTKAFTAMAAVVSADEGKLSLDDSPKKYLPYFKLQDAEADAKITVRDLLHHSSGLDRTDLIWYTGVLSREEVIRAVAAAKPTAKLREKFQYQNVMYSAAGEVVAKAQRTTWEEVIARRFFRPLGMRASNTSVKEMQRAPDFATGYSLAEKVAKKVPMRELPNIAPAGAINSNARDMAQWLRLVLGGGVFEGRRLVSEKGFNEVVSKHIAAGGKNSYGLGWVLGEWRGHKTLAHGGGIDGFNSLVALMPEEKLGFVVLTNVSSSLLPSAVQEAVWSNLAGKSEMVAGAAPAAGSDAERAASDPQKEAGSYFLAEANLTIEVLFKDGKLIAKVPGQPEYPLTSVGGRRYKFGAPAPDGFFMTFRPVKGREADTEMYLEQPHGNYVLPKRKAEDAAVAAAALASYSGPHKELIGSYERSGRAIEIAVKEGRVALIVPGQPAYPLIEKEKDSFGATNLPDTYRLSVKRDGAGKVSGLLIRQPEGEFEFTRVAAAAHVSISVEELMAKVIEATGGEANLRKHHSMLTTASLDFENQAMAGELTGSAKAPNLATSHLTLTALGKKIGTIREYFDGAAGGTETSFAPAEIYAGKQLENARIAADFYAELNWKTSFKTVTIKSREQVGDEDVYVVVKTPEKGDPVTDYISAKSFLVLKRDRLVSLSAGQGTLPLTESYSDYRVVDGVLLPFQVVTKHPTLGNVITRVKEIKFNVDIPEATFRGQAKM